MGFVFFMGDVGILGSCGMFKFAVTILFRSLFSSLSRLTLELVSSVPLDRLADIMTS